MHGGRTCRAVGWQPTGFGCLLFACWANLQGRRLATYLVWMSIICMLGELVGRRLATYRVYRVVSLGAKARTTSVKTLKEDACKCKTQLDSSSITTGNIHLWF